MPDIVHRVGIQSSLESVYTALTTRDGLAGWWTTNTQGEGSHVGGVVQFRFGAGGFDMKVLELEPGKRVLWEVVDGPPEWIGTKCVGSSSRTATTPSSSSRTRDGRSPSSSCTTAAPSGRSSW